jgi:hypothetical protein
MMMVNGDSRFVNKLETLGMRGAMAPFSYQVYDSYFFTIKASGFTRDFLNISALEV